MRPSSRAFEFVGWVIAFGTVAVVLLALTYALGVAIRDWPVDG